MDHPLQVGGEPLRVAIPRLFRLIALGYAALRSYVL